MRSFLVCFLALFALVAVFLSSSSGVAADPEFISGGDSAYVPGVSAVDWGNGRIEQPYISDFANRKTGGNWGGKTSTPAVSGTRWGGGWKKRRSEEVGNKDAAAPVDATAAAAAAADASASAATPELEVAGGEEAAAFEAPEKVSPQQQQEQQ